MPRTELPFAGHEFDPCPPDQPCENCRHPMRGHFRGNGPEKNFGTRCGACRCEHWSCQHGGVRALIPVEEL